MFRPFPRHLFSQGQKQGPDLLLQVWRHDVAVDWKALEEQYMPRTIFPDAESINTNMTIARVSGERKNRPTNSGWTCIQMQQLFTLEGRKNRP